MPCSPGPHGPFRQDHPGKPQDAQRPARPLSRRAVLAGGLSLLWAPALLSQTQPRLPAPTRMLFVIVGGGIRRQDLFGNEDHATPLSGLLPRGSYFQAVKSETPSRHLALQRIVTAMASEALPEPGATPQAPQLLEVLQRAGLPVDELAWVQSGTGPELALSRPKDPAFNGAVFTPSKLLTPTFRELALELNLKQPDAKTADWLQPLLDLQPDTNGRPPLNMLHAYATWLGAQAHKRRPAPSPPGSEDLLALDLATHVWKQCSPRFLAIDLSDAATTMASRQEAVLKATLPAVQRLAASVLDGGHHVAIMGDRGRDDSVNAEGERLDASGALSVRRVGAFFAGPGIRTNHQPRVSARLIDLFPTALQAMGLSLRGLDLEGRPLKGAFS